MSLKKTSSNKCPSNLPNPSRTIKLERAPYPRVSRHPPRAQRTLNLLCRARRQGYMPGSSRGARAVYHSANEPATAHTTAAAALAGQSVAGCSSGGGGARPHFKSLRAPSCCCSSSELYGLCKPGLLHKCAHPLCDATWRLRESLCRLFLFFFCTRLLTDPGMRVRRQVRAQRGACN